MRRLSLAFVVTYLVLSVYFYYIPMLVPMNDMLRFLHLLLFLPLAHFITKQLSGNGLESYGLFFFKGWFKNLWTGFLIGFIAWSILFMLYFAFGRYTSIQFINEPRSILTVVIIIVGFGLGSLLNDLLVRGLVFSYFKTRLTFSQLFIFSVILYALDDCWNEGLSVQNIIFSISLGLSLTYSFFKSGSIWANTGIHMGLNVVYGLFFGVSGNIGDGIFTFTVSDNPVIQTSWLSSILAFIMFIIIYSKQNQLFVTESG
ncbi:CPBP family intramembrane metalloprotease [Bacillus sp. BGMRC 2118]|nr:CPBP family intramembrane metalloprotease [Bacillus sp. BGMRC 2118]